MMIYCPNCPSGNKNRCERNQLCEDCRKRDQDSDEDPYQILEPLFPKITVKLTNTEGNSFSILSKVTRAFQLHKVPKEATRAFMNEATLGDYDHLIRTCMKYVNVK